jgi:hypothetical protein
VNCAITDTLLNSDDDEMELVISDRFQMGNGIVLGRGDFSLTVGFEMQTEEKGTDDILDVFEVVVNNKC